jgi:hypothetical protein
MVLGDHLHKAASHFHKQDEVLHDVQKALRVTGPLQGGFQRDDTFLPLAVDLLPFVEVSPLRGDTSDLGLAAV